MDLNSPVNTEFGGAKVWAIGGGKGGTGKSFITSSLGVCLASRGNRVVLLDADLGGANLHSFLGVKKPRASLTEFFEKNVSLSELVVESGVERVGLVTGDLQSLASDDVKHVQKLKLFRHIRALDADYVLIDLGSGSHYNTIDTFLLADRMVVVIVPEITAIENMYHFVKNVFFRKLKVTLAEYGVKDTVLEIWKNREAHGLKNIRDLVEHMKAQWPRMAAVFDKMVSGFEISLVLNQIRGASDIPIGSSVRSVFRKYLGFGTLYVGYVEYDEAVWRCTNMGKPFVLACPSSNSTREIHRALDNLLGGAEIHSLRA